MKAENFPVFSLLQLGQLYSAMDYENYCRMKFGDKIRDVRVKRGIACSHKNNQGLIRTIDIHLTPAPGTFEMWQDPVIAGELKSELEQRSPYLYNFRVMIENDFPHQQIK